MRKKGVGRTKILLICSLILLLITFFLISRSNLLTIKNVDVHLDKVECTDANSIKNSTYILGQNIIFLNSSKIENEIKKRFICVKAVEVRRNFPNKVDILASGRVPKAMLLIYKNPEASGSALENLATPSARQINDLEQFVIDDEIVFSKVSNILDIYKIYSFQKVSLGQNLDYLTLNALKILDKVRTFNVADESEILDGLLIIYTKDGPRIVFKLEGDLDTKLASLQLILGQAKIDEKDLEFIDLRFDKPIVKFAPKRHG